VTTYALIFVAGQLLVDVGLLLLHFTDAHHHRPAGGPR